MANRSVVAPPAAPGTTLATTVVQPLAIRLRARLREVQMSGRRSHPRFGVSQPWDGELRVLRDVMVDRTGPDELVVVSHVPGVAGEVQSLDLLGGGAAMTLRVTVLDSRPVIVSGTVRHRLRLGVIPEAN